jgi:hypothetical protein
MPWRGATVDEQRQRFLEDYKLNFYSVTELGPGDSPGSAPQAPSPCPTPEQISGWASTPRTKREARSATVRGKPYRFPSRNWPLWSAAQMWFGPLATVWGQPGCARR